MKNNTIQHVFFDLDHTLWDFDKNSEMAFATIFKQDHPEIAIADFIEKYAPINQACWKLYQYDKITHEELRYKRLKDSFDALNYTISDAAIHQMAEDYITFLAERGYRKASRQETAMLLRNHGFVIDKKHVKKEDGTESTLRVVYGIQMR